MNKQTLRVTAYKVDSQYYAKDRLGRLWGGPAKTKAELRKQISRFNKKPVNAPKIVLK